VTEFPDWKRRDNFSVDAHQRMIDGLRKLFNVPGAGVATLPHNLHEPRIGESCVVKLTRNATGGGKYVGRIWYFTDNDVSESTTLGDADFGLDPDVPPLQPGSLALVLNTLEKGQDTHDLTNAAATNANGFFCGVIRSRNSDGKWVVIVDGVPWKNCPTT
jgi:hypothetical protein